MTARQMHILALISQTTKALTARRSRRLRPKVGGNEAGDLIAALAAAPCPVVGGPSVAVGEVIEQDAAYYDHAPAMESQGVALVAGRRGPRGSFRVGKTRVFVDPDVVASHLLGGGRWGARDVARILLGVKGAVHRQRSLGGRRRRGIELPLASWAALAGAGEFGPPGVARSGTGRVPQTADR